MLCDSDIWTPANEKTLIAEANRVLEHAADIIINAANDGRISHKDIKEKLNELQESGAATEHSLANALNRLCRYELVEKREQTKGVLVHMMVEDVKNTTDSAKSRMETLINLKCHPDGVYPKGFVLDWPDEPTSRLILGQLDGTVMATAIELILAQQDGHIIGPIPIGPVGPLMREVD